MARRGDLGCPKSRLTRRRRTGPTGTGRATTINSGTASSSAVRSRAGASGRSASPELDVLGEVDGKDVLELGCGAAQWSILLAKQGARPVGLDNSERQLEHARERLGRGRRRLPARPCERGGHSTSRPELRRRVLRPRRLHVRGSVQGRARGGAAPPAGRASRLQPLESVRRRLRGRGRARAPDADTRATSGCTSRTTATSSPTSSPTASGSGCSGSNGFVVEDLIEPRPEPDATSTYWDDEERDWARRWPSESIWKARKAG